MSVNNNLTKYFWLVLILIGIILIILGCLLFVIVFYGISSFYNYLASDAVKLPKIPKMT